MRVLEITCEPLRSNGSPESRWDHLNWGVNWCEIPWDEDGIISIISCNVFNSTTISLLDITESCIFFIKIFSLKYCWMSGFHALFCLWMFIPALLACSGWLCACIIVPVYHLIEWLEIEADLKNVMDEWVECRILKLPMSGTGPSWLIA